MANDADVDAVIGWMRFAGGNAGTDPRQGSAGRLEESKETDSYAGYAASAGSYTLRIL